MSDSFDTPLSSAESSSLVSDIVKALTTRRKIEELINRALDQSWHPSDRKMAPEMGLDTFSGLFVYVCQRFITTHLIRKTECLPDYPDGWYHAEGRRISISQNSALEKFFLDGTPRKRDNGDDLTDTGVKLYTAIVQKLHPAPSHRWLAALGLLLAFDEGEGRGGKRFPADQEIERDEIIREASSLTVQYNGQNFSSDFVASVLEIYAKNVCKSIVAKPQQPCPHCGQLKPEKSTCPHCGIDGEFWTCPSCGNRTPVTTIPKHGSSGMYCPNCGIPVVGAASYCEKLQNAMGLPPDKGLEKLKSLQLEYQAAIGFDASWGKLNFLVEQLTAAATALDKIANALKGKNLSDAETLLASARLEFPDLDYSQFERQIADLRKEEERRERQKRELAAAVAAIQAAVVSGDYSAARRRVDETARRNLPGFKADEWRQKISQAEAKAKAEKLEADRKKAKEEYEAALNDGRWDDAAMRAHKRERLGDGKFETYKDEIDQWKAKRREKLEEACTKAIDDFKRNYPENLDAAEAALSSAKNALKTLEKEFRGSPVIGSTRNAIAKGLEDVAAKKRENVLNELRPVQSLTATGSADGKPTIAISWKPGSGGTQVAKWQVWRREKGMSGKGVKLGEFAGTETKREDSRSDLKIGVEYEYGVMPMAEIEGTFKPNEKAVVWSAPAVCLVRLPDNALSGTGQGMEGVGGVVTLKWKMPEGVPSGAPHRLFLSRGDGKFSDMDVTDFKELFEDTNVSIDATLEYSLRFELCGRDMGTSKKRISVEKVPPPPSVGKITFGRNAQGSLLAKWDWPAGLDSCIWGVTADKANSPADIPKIARNPVSKRTYAEKGGVVAKPLDGGGSCWISVFGARTFGDKEFYSAGRCAPLGETKLAYAIDAHPGGVFSKRKPAFLVIKSSTGYFPELDVRASRIRADVLSPRGGRSVLRTESETGITEKRIPLDGLVPPGEYVGVFLVHPETENCRIDPPSDFEVK